MSYTIGFPNVKDIENETRRVYHYPGGLDLEFTCVYRVRVGSAGHHYLDYEGDKKAIIAPGWAWIEVNATVWDA